jgi:hypothetical protein
MLRAGGMQTKEITILREKCSALRIAERQVVIVGSG